jgi:hypothetical protein
MPDLSDIELQAILAGDGPDCACVCCRAAAEIRRHRAMVKRLEAWAVELESQPSDWPAIPREAVAFRLRELMGGDHG